MKPSDRDIASWDLRLKRHVLKRYDNYIRRRIDLDTARDKELWAITGEFIYIEKTSSQSARMQIRLDKSDADSLDLFAGVRIDTLFADMYLSNDAQAGEWIDLLVGINFEYHKPHIGDNVEVQSVIKLTHANPNTNVTSASRICTRVLIKANVLNTDIAWIDFGTAAVQNACCPLDAGEWIRVAISNLDQINANFEAGGECVFIVYEV